MLESNLFYLLNNVLIIMKWHHARLSKNSIVSMIVMIMPAKVGLNQCAYVYLFVWNNGYYFYFYFFFNLLHGGDPYKVKSCLHICNKADHDRQLQDVQLIFNNQSSQLKFSSINFKDIHLIFNLMNPGDIWHITIPNTLLNNIIQRYHDMC